MTHPLSGVDAISPAIERTRQQLFIPFRLRHWTRLAAVALATGELTGGGGGSWGGLGNIHLPAGGKSGKEFSLLPDRIDPRLMEYLPWVAAGICVLVVLSLALVYVSSVFRFILFDAVLHNRCEMGKGWRRWQPQGISYFLWTIGFGLAGLVVMMLVLGGPLYFMRLAGVFTAPRMHIAPLLVLGIILITFAVAFIVVSVLGSLIARDFVVPVMALENVGVLEGWRRVLPMLELEKGAYAIYVLMKTVLAVGSAVLFGIIDVLVLLAILIPLGIVAVMVVLAGSAAGLSWDRLTLSAAVLAGGVVLMALIYIIALVSTPAMVFFQAYTLHFFGSRYPLLGDRLALTSHHPIATPPLPAAAST